MESSTTANTGPGGISTAWPLFAQKLSVVLERLGEDEFVVISAKRSTRFVQFASQGALGTRAESVSNHYLSRSERLDDQQLAGLKALGWRDPTGSAEEATPGGDPHGSPNFFVKYPVPVPFAAVAELAVRTLVEVMRVPHPGSLQHEAFDADHNALQCLELGLKRATKSEGSAALPPLLLATVQQETGIFDLAFDADGDIGVSFGSANAYVRLVGDPPHVCIHSPLVRGIDATPALLAPINELNCAVIHPHFLFIGGAICAVTDVPASRYVPEHVAHALQELCKVSESIAELLQAEFSEGSTFGAAMSSALKH